MMKKTIWAGLSALFLSNIVGARTMPTDVLYTYRPAPIQQKMEKYPGVLCIQDSEYFWTRFHERRGSLKVKVDVQESLYNILEQHFEEVVPYDLQRSAETCSLIVEPRFFTEIQPNVGDHHTKVYLSFKTSYFQKIGVIYGRDFGFGKKRIKKYEDFREVQIKSLNVAFDSLAKELQSSTTKRLLLPYIADHIKDPGSLATDKKIIAENPVVGINARINENFKYIAAIAFVRQYPKDRFTSGAQKELEWETNAFRLETDKETIWFLKYKVGAVEKVPDYPNLARLRYCIDKDQDAECSVLRTMLVDVSSQYAKEVFMNFKSGDELTIATLAGTRYPRKLFADAVDDAVVDYKKYAVQYLAGAKPPKSKKELRKWKKAKRFLALTILVDQKYPKDLSGRFDRDKLKRVILDVYKNPKYLNAKVKELDRKIRANK